MAVITPWDGPAPFSTLLVANRGEIAVRIVRTARRLGIRTVAVHSDADARAPHTRAADVAVRLGPAPAAESYLNIDRLLEAAAATGADAVHPGYGFLSERAAFARAVTDVGLIFVGPPADVIDRMGRKDIARQIAIGAGVPVLPSFSLDSDPESLPYPLLVKAASGGGGKGMRVVRSAVELPAAMEAARREAAAAFGDDTLLLERFVERGRHVEVQVLADAHGNVVHLHERDCSAQRRHQKVIEEAPAPDLTEDVRRLLHDSAVTLARRVGYVNAGTVEFLVAGDEVFFLEMNTRLQVEHPVTEAITGLDLVAQQILIAGGGRIPFTQDEIACRGHAFEARVYAEDAWNGFLPQAGTATHVHWPAVARVDAALVPGQRVTTHYDPMLGKVIVHGPDREQARRRLIAALDETAIVGLTTNTGYVRALAADPVFRAGPVDTTWLDTHVPETPDAGTPRELAACALMAAAAVDDSPFGIGDGWRPGQSGTVRAVVLDGQAVDVDLARLVRPRFAAVAADHVDIAYRGQWFRYARRTGDGRDGTAVADGSVLAPMPGTVTRVDVETGQQVAAGQRLGVLEAMKMEVALTAPFAGTVTAVPRAVQAAHHAVLFVVEPEKLDRSGT